MDVTQDPAVRSLSTKDGSSVPAARLIRTTEPVEHVIHSKRCETCYTSGVLQAFELVLTLGFHQRSHRLGLFNTGFSFSLMPLSRCRVRYGTAELDSLLLP